MDSFLCLFETYKSPILNEITHIPMIFFSSGDAASVGNLLERYRGLQAEVTFQSK